MDSALATARDLATRDPEADLPCPVCGNEMKGGSLDAHLAKVHPIPTVPAEWAGTDQASAFFAIGLGVLAIFIALAASSVSEAKSQLFLGITADNTVAPMSSHEASPG